MNSFCWLLVLYFWGSATFMLYEETVNDPVVAGDLSFKKHFSVIAKLKVVFLSALSAVVLPLVALLVFLVERVLPKPRKWFVNNTRVGQYFSAIYLSSRLDGIPTSFCEQILSYPTLKSAKLRRVLEDCLKEREGNNGKY